MREGLRTFRIWAQKCCAHCDHTEIVRSPEVMAEFGKRACLFRQFTFATCTAVLQHGGRAQRKLLGFEFCEGRGQKVTVSLLGTVYNSLCTQRPEYGDERRML